MPSPPYQNLKPLIGNYQMQAGWIIAEKNFQADQIVATGSNFMIGNGYLGYRGTFEEWGRDHCVACIVTDTYDTADEKWTELCNVPNGLFVELLFNGNNVRATEEEVSDYQRALNLKQALFSRSFQWRKADTRLTVEVEKFSSMVRLNTLALRYQVTADRAGELTFITGIDGDLWSLNGDHFRTMQCHVTGDQLTIDAITKELGTEIVVKEGARIFGATVKSEAILRHPHQIFRKITLPMAANETVTLEKYVEIRHSNESDQPDSDAAHALRSATEAGFEALKSDHCAAWEELWRKVDIEIDGDEVAQTLAHYNLYHNIIATPRHASLQPSAGERGMR